MAVYTDVSDDDLAGFVARYDIGEPIAFKGIAEGVSNSNFFLQTTKDRYILTVYEARAPREDLPFFIGLMDHLAIAASPAPNLSGCATGKRSPTSPASPPRWSAISTGCR